MQPRCDACRLRRAVESPRRRRRAQGLYTRMPHNGSLRQIGGESIALTLLVTPMNAVATALVPSRRPSLTHTGTHTKAARACPSRSPTRLPRCADLVCLDAPDLSANGEASLGHHGRGRLGRLRTHKKRESDSTGS
eukprot:4998114-Pleurochrysis_carterae.AAC.1